MWCSWCLCTQGVKRKPRCYQGVGNVSSCLLPYQSLGKLLHHFIMHVCKHTWLLTIKCQQVQRAYKTLTHSSTNRSTLALASGRNIVGFQQVSHRGKMISSLLHPLPASLLLHPPPSSPILHLSSSTPLLHPSPPPSPFLHLPPSQLNEATSTK